jgi:hypothetical protein
MAHVVRKSLDTPEESRPFEGGTGKLEVVNLDRGPLVEPPSSPAGGGRSTSSRSPGLTAARQLTPGTSSRVA